VIYSALMREKTQPDSSSLQVVVCAWIVLAEVWYYAQFREQFRFILLTALHRLWH
jgi:hypothetical protein